MKNGGNKLISTLIMLTGFALMAYAGRQQNDQHRQKQNGPAPKMVPDDTTRIPPPPDSVPMPPVPIPDSIPR